MRISGKALRQVHDAFAPFVKPGATTMDLENAAVCQDRRTWREAAFKGYHGYPAALCTSVNDEVVHGIPSEKRVLNEGDIVSIDCGVIIDGFYSDAAVTYPVGKVSPETRKLLDVTLGVARSRHSEVPGRRPPLRHLRRCSGDVRGRRFRSSPRFCRPRYRQSMHEDPQVPNFGRGQRPTAQGGHGAGHRADDQCRQPEVRVLQGRMDHRYGRWKLQRPLRAHRRHHKRWPPGAYPLGNSQFRGIIRDAACANARCQEWTSTH